MKTLVRIIVFLIMLAAVIFGTRFIVQYFGPGDWEKRIEDRKLSAEKRIALIKENLNRVLELHKKHISSINSLIKIYKELASASQDKIKNLEVLSDIQNQAGNEYFKARFITEAIKYYELALELNPHETEALVRAGIAHYNIGLYEREPEKIYKEFLKAEEYYTKAVNITNRRDEMIDKQWEKQAYLYLSLMYREIREKKIDEMLRESGIESAKRDFLTLAIENALKLYNKDPEYTQGLFMLGALYYMKGDMPKSRKFYSLIIALNQANPSQKEKAKNFINKIDLEMRDSSR